MHGRIFVISGDPNAIEYIDLDDVANDVYERYRSTLYCDYVVPMEPEHLETEVRDIVDYIGKEYIKKMPLNCDETEETSEDEDEAVFVINIPSTDREALLKKMFDKYKEQAMSFIESMSLDRFGSTIELDLDVHLDRDVFFYHSDYGLLRMRNLLYDYGYMANENNEIYVIGVLDYHF